MSKLHASSLKAVLIVPLELLASIKPSNTAKVDHNFPLYNSVYQSNSLFQDDIWSVFLACLALSVIGGSMAACLVGRELPIEIITVVIGCKIISVILGVIAYAAVNYGKRRLLVLPPIMILLVCFSFIL